MSAAHVEPASGALAETREQRVVVYGMPWEAYCAIREAFDRPSLRLTYLAGALEFMSPSDDHELLKKRIARLVEAFGDERDVPLYGHGSTTFRRKAREAGLEPDESYVLGGERPEYPDVAIEVVVSSGGLSKLDVYARLGVPEVWFWIDGGFQLFALGDSGYQAVTNSRLIPGLDFELLARFARRVDQPQAIKEYRQLLRAGR